jgi:ADP-heptose:LPS heptosyltransferase
MKIIGNLGGQYGDLAMCAVLAKAIKQKWPNSYYKMMLSRKYSDIFPLFLRNKYIDDVGVWDSYYEDFPSQGDYKIKTLECPDFSFHPFPQHREHNWFEKRHQCAEVCHMYGIEPPSDLQIELENYFKISPLPSKKVGVSVFGGYNASHKSLSVENAEKLVSTIKSLGFEPVQIGHPSEPRLSCGGLFGPYVSNVVDLLGMRALVAVDTGLSWIMSGYSFPVLGLYSNDYYGKEFVKNIQPINKNAIYLDSKHVNDIESRIIVEAVEKLLT